MRCAPSATVPCFFIASNSCVCITAQLSSQKGICLEVDLKGDIVRSASAPSAVAAAQNSLLRDQQGATVTERYAATEFDEHRARALSLKILLQNGPQEEDEHKD